MFGRLGEAETIRNTTKCAGSVIKLSAADQLQTALF